MSERRGRIHEKHDLSKTRRCELLDVPRSNVWGRDTPPRNECRPISQRGYHTPMEVLDVGPRAAVVPCIEALPVSYGTPVR